MTYFLDFDRTLFDTEAFKNYLFQRSDFAELTHAPEFVFTAEFERRRALGEELFTPGELTQFLYYDAAQFLRDKENAATIITYGNPQLQKEKIRSALVGIPRLSVMYTGDVRKGTYLEPHTHLHLGAVLADDAPIELEILANECPDIRLFEMRRDGGVGDGRWPVVRSLTELP